MNKTLTTEQLASFFKTCFEKTKTWSPISKYENNAVSLYIDSDHSFISDKIGNDIVNENKLMEFF